MGDLFTGPVSREDIVARLQAHPLGDGTATQRKRFARLVLGERVDVDGDAGVDLTVAGERGTIVYFHGGG